MPLLWRLRELLNAGKPGYRPAKSCLLPAFSHRTAARPLGLTGSGLGEGLGLSFGDGLGLSSVRKGGFRFAGFGLKPGSILRGRVVVFIVLFSVAVFYYRFSTNPAAFFDYRTRCFVNSLGYRWLISEGTLAAGSPIFERQGKQPPLCARTQFSPDGGSNLKHAVRGGSSPVEKLALSGKNPLQAKPINQCFLHKSA